MANDVQAGVLPQRALGNEERFPVASAQGDNELRRRVQHRPKLVKKGQRVANRPPCGVDAVALDCLGLQPVELRFQLWMRVPDEAIEQVVQVVARGHLPGACDEGFIGLTNGCQGLFNKHARCLRQVQGRGH